MANRDIKQGLNKFSQTVGKNDKLTRGLIQAGTSITKRTTKQTNQAKPKAPSVSSYKEYLDMSPEDISRLKTSELRGVVARLNRIEFKRLKNLEKYGFTDIGYNTQAQRDLAESGGKTKATTDMARNELLHEYKRAKSFLMAETSTVQGSKNFIKGIQEAVGANEPLTKDEINKLFEAYHKFSETGAIGYYIKGDKNSAEFQNARAKQKEIYGMIKEDSDISVDEILNKLGVMSKSEIEAGENTSTEFNWSGRHHP